MERTFAIIKPDAVERNIVGKVTSRIEKNGFKIVGLKMLYLTKKEAEGFYIVHKERPFFNSLTDSMSSGKIVVMVLEKENAILDWRDLMGATNPEEAKEGTIRKDLAVNIEQNSVHGSDSPENAKIEISYFFGAKDLL